MTTNNTFNNQKREGNNTFCKTNSQDLTELWKKGELEQGWYYVKNEFGNIFISEYSKDYDFIGERVISGFFTEVSEIIEIICEVPDYLIWKNYVNGYCDEHEYNLKLQEENERLKKWVEEFNALNVAEENQRLKQLLKECGRQLEEVELCRYDVADVDQEDWFRISTEQTGIAKKMKAKIDEVLK